MGAGDEVHSGLRIFCDLLELGRVNIGAQEAGSCILLSIWGPKVFHQFLF